MSSEEKPIIIVEKTKKITRGHGAGEALLLIFIVLKLVGVEPIASWSWWWVFSPLWIVGGLVGAFAASVGVVMLIDVVVVGVKERRALKRGFEDVDE